MATIADKLNELISDKNDIRLAIIEKGGISPSSHNFSDFANDIKTIPLTGTTAPSFTADPLVNRQKYIEFDGTQYVDLERTLVSGNDHFFCQFYWGGQYGTQDHDSAVFGQRISATSGASQLLISAGKLIWRVNGINYNANRSSSATNVTLQSNRIYTGIFLKRGMMMDTLYSINGSNTTYGTYRNNLYIGGCNQEGTVIQTFVGKVYRFAWWDMMDDSTTDMILPIMDLVPAYNNGQYCFYDTVGQRYYYAAQGTLTGQV